MTRDDAPGGRRPPPVPETDVDLRAIETADGTERWEASYDDATATAGTPSAALFALAEEIDVRVLARLVDVPMADDRADAGGGGRAE